MISGAGDAADSLRDEIATLEQMASIADQLKSTILDLQTGSLSALAPQDQVAAAAAAYGDTLSRARWRREGLQALPGAATQFLTEQQSFDASGGSYGAHVHGRAWPICSPSALRCPRRRTEPGASATHRNWPVVDNTDAMAADCSRSTPR